MSPELDEAVARVAAKKDAWLAVTIAERIAYLKKCLAGLLAAAPGWVEDVCRIKGIAPGDVLEGEEWIAGPWTTVRNVQLLIHALEHGGHPPAPSLTKRKGGQVVAQVFPGTLQDRVLFTGMRAEVWIEPGKEPTQGAVYRTPPTEGKVSLVLGGGNVSSIPPMDVLYKLFVESEVVVLKMNPVNAAFGPRLEQAFASLIADGYLAVAYGGADVGAALASDPRVDTLHVTGSDRTYDAIVWGSDPEERARRKAEGKPVNARRFSAELGCVTPVLVVPGPWSAADMEFQARHVAGMVAQNASFNCNAAKVIITAKGWLQRPTFLRMVEEALAKAPPRKAYYPGAEDRYAKFLDAYPRAKKLGKEGEGVVPWTLIPDVAADANEYALRNEAFCGVLAEVSIDASDAREFLAKAVPFANDAVWGTLSACMLVHPSTVDTFKAEVEQAIAELRYGGIGVNAWPAVLYGLGVTSWGAYPGHVPEDIRSGVGVVHNTYLFDHPQKSVVYAPFRIRPKPVWFPDHKSLAEVGKKLTELEAAPSWGKVFGVAMAAMRG
jgi:acyl-CoA reductase-like NAD-dependent aldehyde dehydrogenase